LPLQNIRISYIRAIMTTVQLARLSYHRIFTERQTRLQYRTII